MLLMQLFPDEKIIVNHSCGDMQMPTLKHLHWKYLWKPLSNYQMNEGHSFITEYFTNRNYWNRIIS